MSSTNPNLYAVILAGGSGTRFWPLSRASIPKQFLTIYGKSSLFQQTLQRIQSLVPVSNILVVTNQEYKKKVQQQMVSFAVPQKNVLLEPEGKNTAPAICWAAHWIARKNPDAMMMVLPSDHLILKPETFLKVLKQAVDLAEKDFLVTLGIVPTRPETGYGYLKTRQTRDEDISFLRVEEFTEKPSLAKANQFIRSDKYFWNSGMFVWKVNVILSEFKQHQPIIYQLFSRVKNLHSVKSFWSKFPSISVDYAILERSLRVAAVPARHIGWSDVGSWEALADISPKDKKSNVWKGNIIDIESENVFVFGHDKLIATIGLKDVVIIDTPDALLVCRRDLSQKVRDMVELLKSQARKESQ